MSGNGELGELDMEAAVVQQRLQPGCHTVCVCVLFLG